MMSRDRGGFTPGPGSFGRSNSNNNNNNKGTSSSQQRINKLLERLDTKNPKPPPYAGLLPAEDVEHAHEAARQAAEILRRFGATRVVLFGSLAREYGFTVDSDINLAEEGILPDDYFEACNAAGELSKAHPINVVDLGSMAEGQRKSVLAQGRLL